MFPFPQIWLCQLPSLPPSPPPTPPPTPPPILDDCSSNFLGMRINKRKSVTQGPGILEPPCWVCCRAATLWGTVLWANPEGKGRLAGGFRGFPTSEVDGRPGQELASVSCDGIGCHGCPSGRKQGVGLGCPTFWLRDQGKSLTDTGQGGEKCVEGSRASWASPLGFPAWLTWQRPAGREPSASEGGQVTVLQETRGLFRKVFVPGPAGAYHSP